MQKVQLGKTGLKVTRVGFGGIPIQRLTDQEAIEVVRGCVDMGINFIDTANGYTTSEERIGAALVGRRKEVIIATKTGARDRATALEHLSLSLKRLQTDYVDLWQFHGVSTPEALAQVLGPGGAMEAAQEAKAAGQVRHIGITSHSMEVALDAVLMGHFETMQFPFNYVTNEPAQELIPLCRENGVGFIAMKSFGGGLLDKANLSIKYLLQFDGVVPDPGIETVDEMSEIIEIIKGPWEMTVAERAELERVREEVGTRFCRRCQYCMPCEQGVQISTVMNAKSFWKRFPEDRFTGGWVAEAILSAENCIECGECEEKCPYHLAIIETLAENVAFFKRVAAQG